MISIDKTRVKRFSGHINGVKMLLFVEVILYRSAWVSYFSDTMYVRTGHSLELLWNKTFAFTEFPYLGLDLNSLISSVCFATSALFLIIVDLKYYW